jgi:FkbM family methyltransferase
MNIFIDEAFAQVYQDDPLVLVDVGARGGLKSNWIPAKPHLRVVGFEPDPNEFEQLSQRPDVRDGSTVVVGSAVHNRKGPARFHLAQDRGLSSIFEPNHEFLAAFPEAGRFETTAVREVSADALDTLLPSRNIHSVDFLKADTQGSELFVLQGAERLLASSVLGVEVEVEFTPIYRDQPLFADVDAYLRRLGFHLFDLRPVYWKRAAGRNIGGPRGQIVWADALYLKTVPALAAAIAPMAPERRKAKVLKAISIALLYGYFDYALELAATAGDALSGEERDRIERQVRKGGAASGTPEFPGQRPLAAALRRLWQAVVPRDDEAWSVSRAELGNRG